MEKVELMVVMMQEMAVPRQDLAATYPICKQILKFTNGLVLASVIMKRFFSRSHLSNCQSHLLPPTFVFSVKSTALAGTTMLQKDTLMQVRLKRRSHLASRLVAPELINLYTGRPTLLLRHGYSCQTCCHLMYRLQEM